MAFMFSFVPPNGGTAAEFLRRRFPFLLKKAVRLDIEKRLSSEKSKVFDAENGRVRRRLPPGRLRPFAAKNFAPLRSGCLSCPSCFHRKSNRCISSASAARPWRRPRRPCRTRASPSPARTKMCMSPCPLFSPPTKIAVMNGYAEQNLKHKPDLVVDRQRHFARQSRGGVRAGSQTALLLAAGIAPGIFHPRQALARRRRHARQNHHHLAAGMGVRAQRAEPELSHRRHSRIIFRRARGSRTANGSSSRATNMTPRFSTNAANSSITCRRSPSSTIWNSITRTFLRTSMRSRRRSNISSIWFRATANAARPTATTPTSRRCSTSRIARSNASGLGEGNAVQAFNVRYGPTATEFEIPSFKFT
jgi:hypothetical protein